MALGWQAETIEVRSDGQARIKGAVLAVSAPLVGLERAAPAPVRAAAVVRPAMAVVLVSLAVPENAARARVHQTPKTAMARERHPRRREHTASAVPFARPVRSWVAVSATALPLRQQQAGSRVPTGSPLAEVCPAAWQIQLPPSGVPQPAQVPSPAIRRQRIGQEPGSFPTSEVAVPQLPSRVVARSGPRQDCSPGRALRAVKMGERGRSVAAVPPVSRVREPRQVFPRCSALLEWRRVSALLRAWPLPIVPAQPAAASAVEEAMALVRAAAMRAVARVEQEQAGVSAESRAGKPAQLVLAAGP